MNRDRTLTALSLISIVLMAFHLTGDFALGIDKGAASPVAVLILVVWSCGTLVLGRGRWGLGIMLLGGLMGAAMPILHFRGPSVGRAAESTLGIFFLWGLFLIGTTGSVAAILSMRALWRGWRQTSEEVSGLQP